MGLQEKVKSGFLWSTGLNFFRDVLQFGITLMLVRLLAPAAYGQFGFVTAVTGFFTILSFRSFLEHTLQLRDQDTVDYQTHFTTGAILQVCVFLAANIVAVVLRYVPTYRETAPLIHVMSLLFLLDLPSEFRVKMLERALDWKRLRIIQACGALLNAIAAFAMALSGAGVYALLVPGMLVTLPAIYDLFFLARWRPNWSLDWHGYHSSLRYGFTRIGRGVITTGRQLLESSGIVYAVGFSSFGMYGRAVGLASLACLKLPSLLTQMLYPILTRIEPRTSKYNRASSLILQSVGWVVIPGAALLTVIGEPVIRVVYGPKWLGAVPLLPWALAVACTTALNWTGETLLLASFEQRKCLVTDVVVFVGMVLALTLLAPRGLTAYMMGITGIQFVSFSMMLFWLHEIGSISKRAIWNGLALPILAVAAVVLLGGWLIPSPVKSTFLASAYAATFTLAYLGVLRFASPGVLSDLVSYCPGGGQLRRLLWLNA